MTNDRRKIDAESGGLWPSLFFMVKLSEHSLNIPQPVKVSPFLGPVDEFHIQKNIMIDNHYT